MQVTQEEYDAMQKELNDLDTQIEEARQEQQIARGFGDVSENSELEIATNKITTLTKRKIELTESLSSCEICAIDNSPRFTIGSKVIVTRLNAAGVAISEPRYFTLTNKGNTVMEGKLGINSPLGKAILNGVSGIYTIQTDSGGISYNVTKG